MLSLRLPVVVVAALSSGLMACGGGKRASTDAPKDTPGPGDVADVPRVSDASDTPSGADAGDGPDATAPVATIFLAHSVNNAIYRFSISPGQDPVLNATIPAAKPEGLAMSAKGELFAAAGDGTVLRFLTPLATPAANGKLENLDVSEPEELAFVDDELWIPSTDYQSCTTTASKITRVAFDAAGAGTVAGSVMAAGIVTAGRGVLWVAGSRTLYLSSCNTVNTIAPYQVASDRTVTPVTATMGGDVRNPHGMAMAPWGGELFASNADTNQVLRFTVGADGALAASGNVSGNGLNFPIGLAFAPWGELIVVNQGNGSLSRFSFDDGDAGHAPTPKGTFATGLDSSASTHNLGWMLLVPAASTPAAIADGGADGGG